MDKDTLLWGIKKLSRMNEHEDMFINEPCTYDATKTFVFV